MSHRKRVRTSKDGSLGEPNQSGPAAGPTADLSGERLPEANAAGNPASIPEDEDLLLVRMTAQQNRQELEDRIGQEPAELDRPSAAYRHEGEHD